jgi:quinol-cytochrome oxidoreductase complex cytochrome b subunit
MESTKEKINSQKVNNELKTPVATVIGWLLVFFSPFIMACGYKDGEINVVFWVGVAMLLPGIICIVIGKQKQKKSASFIETKK